jgi:vacuolar-type H+-ATPase subunit E/Vma4
MKAWGSAASVMAAIADDAASEIERLEHAADETIARRHANQTGVPAPVDPGPRLAMARRGAAELDLEQDWQDALAAARDRDEWIAAVIEAGRATLATAGDSVEWTAALVVEAVRQLPAGASVVVAVPAAIRRATDDAWRSALENRTGRSLVFEDGRFSAGCTVRTADGRVSFDNRVDARAARTETAWRTALVRRYDAAVGMGVPTGAA